MAVNGMMLSREDSTDSRPDDHGDLDMTDNEELCLDVSFSTIQDEEQQIEAYEHSSRSEDSLCVDYDAKSRTKTKRSSIYVDAFNLALNTVMEDESHLFNNVELRIFECWKALSFEAQYLYVRLFLRKTSAWHRIARIGYHEDIVDVSAAAKELMESYVLPDSSDSPLQVLGSTDLELSNELERSFTFADSSGEHMNNLEEASSLLLLDELKSFAKDVKAHGKTKGELVKSIRQAGRSQRGLGWKASEKNALRKFGDIGARPKEVDDTDQAPGVEALLLQRILQHTGDCMRLSSGAHNLFERVHLVFYRSTEWTEKSLKAIILAKTSTQQFPDYIVCRSTNIFPSRAALLEFERALRLQFEVDSLLESSGPVLENMRKVESISEKVYPRWKILLTEEQYKEEKVYDIGEGAYLRHFSTAWVYTRIVHKGLAPLGRFKKYQKEYDLLIELLNQRLFHPSRRGAWYQRKALLEEHYMWMIVSDSEQSDDARKKKWKHIAMRTCERALQDSECHTIYHYDLQKRLLKLERALKIAKRSQHDFGHALLSKPLERFVHGVRIERQPSLGVGDIELSRRGSKTVWMDEREGGGECSVEAMCLSWYRDQGWKGYHCEGGVMQTLFSLLFFDVLFTYVPNVFQTSYQICPLDLHTDAFFAARFSLLNSRLAEISNGNALKFLKDVHQRERGKNTRVIGLDWSYDICDLEEIIECFPAEALAIVCKVIAQEYHQRGGGMPDLFLWHPERKEVMFSEVKSENDRLSDTQRLWIHVLSNAGLRVEKCNAVAREVRTCRG